MMRAPAEREHQQERDVDGVDPHTSSFRPNRVSPAAANAVRTVPEIVTGRIERQAQGQIVGTGIRCGQRTDQHTHSGMREDQRRRR